MACWDTDDDALYVGDGATANVIWSSLYPQTEAKYLIYKSGSTIYARNVDTGDIDHSGTDPATVIQYALDNLTNTTVTETDKLLNQGANDPDGSRTVLKFYVEGIIPTTFTHKHTLSTTVNTSNADTDTGDGTGDCDNASTNIASCTIDYNTGEVVITYDSAPDNNTDVTATYNHGRLYKLKVLVKGDYLIDTTLTIPSQTIFELHGRLTHNVSGNNDLINNEGYGLTSAGANNIEIIGGTYDGDGIVKNASGNYTLEFSNVSGLIVKGVTVVDAYSYGIGLHGVNNFLLIDNRVDNPGDDAISVIEKSYDGIIMDNILSNGRSESGASAGIEIEDESHDIIIKGNVIYGHRADGSAKSRGIVVITDSGSAEYVAPYNIVIQGNIIRNVENTGISVGGNGDNGGEYGSNITIAGNEIGNITSVTTATGAINLFYVKYFTVMGNTVHDIDSPSGSMHAVNAQYAFNGTISDNSLYNIDGRGVLVTNSGDVTVSNNSMLDIDLDGVAIVSSPNVIVANNRIKGSSAEGVKVSGASTTNIIIAHNDFTGIGNQINAVYSDDTEGDCISAFGNEGVEYHLYNQSIQDDPLTVRIPYASFRTNSGDGDNYDITIPDGCYIGQERWLYMKVFDTYDVDFAVTGLTGLTFDSVKDFVKIVWTGDSTHGWDIAINNGAALTTDD